MFHPDIKTDIWRMVVWRTVVWRVVVWWLVFWKNSRIQIGWGKHDLYQCKDCTFECCMHICIYACMYIKWSWRTCCLVVGTHQRPWTVQADPGRGRQRVPGYHCLGAGGDPSRPAVWHQWGQREPLHHPRSSGRRSARSGLRSLGVL